MVTTDFEGNQGDIEIIKVFEESNSTRGAVMNQDHQMVNVNLTTQTKVEFELIEGYKYFDCCHLFFEMNRETTELSSNREVGGRYMILSKSG